MKVENIYPELNKSPRNRQEYYLKLIKEKFAVTERQLDPIRQDIKNFEFLEVEVAGETEVQILSDEEQIEAIDYLKNPDLIESIVRDIQYAGDVIGEKNNIIILYLSYSSRKFKKPISTTTFAQSGTGKSYINKTILKFMPPEDCLIISSASAKSFEHLTEDRLEHKIIFVEEK